MMLHTFQILIYKSASDVTKEFYFGEPGGDWIMMDALTYPKSHQTATENDFTLFCPLEAMGKIK